jgi:hypothetical protein
MKKERSKKRRNQVTDVFHVIRLPGQWVATDPADVKTEPVRPHTEQQSRNVIAHAIGFLISLKFISTRWMTRVLGAQAIFTEAAPFCMLLASLIFSSEKLIRAVDF